MPNLKKDTKQASKTNLPIILMIVLIILIVIGIIIMYVSETSGVVLVPVERAVILGFFLLLPCGIFNIITGRKTSAKGFMKNAGVVLGIFITLIGSIALIGYLLLLAAMSQFTY